MVASKLEILIAKLVYQIAKKFQRFYQLLGSTYPAGPAATKQPNNQTRKNIKNRHFEITTNLGIAAEIALLSGLQAEL